MTILQNSPRYMYLMIGIVGMLMAPVLLAQTPIEPDQIAETPIEPDQPPEQQTGTIITERPTSSIARRSISKIGLVSIGLNKASSSVVNAQIWVGTDAPTALELMRATPALGSSPILHRLSVDLIALAATPPAQADRLAEQLVSARLEWLAQAGQAHILSALIQLLPDEALWARWKGWQAEYDLLRRADDKACTRPHSQTSLDVFWAKMHIICALLTGDQSAARLAADILLAEGETDKNFFPLVDRVLKTEGELTLDFDALTGLHLILMDALHVPVPLQAVQDMPISMLALSPYWRYLSAEARLYASFRMRDHGLYHPAQIEQIWRAVKITPPSSETLLAKLETAPLPFTLAPNNTKDTAPAPHHNHYEVERALLWLSLMAREGADTDQLIRDALRQEIMFPRPLFALYARLMRQRLSKPDIAAHAFVRNAPHADDVFVLALYSPDMALPNTWREGREEAQAIIDIMHKGIWHDRQLDSLHSWHLLPLFTALDGGASIPAWHDLEATTEPTLATEPEILDSSAPAFAYQPLAPTQLDALEHAAKARRVAETGLLASQLIQPHRLGWIDPVEGARVIRALWQVGLGYYAERLAREMITAHLLRARFS